MIRPRTLARRLALQYLFMADLTGASGAQPLDEFLGENTDQDEVMRFAAALARRVLQDRDALDGRVQGALRNWSLSRVAPVERNILRIACAEMLGGEVPVAVAMNEAINLAKTFGSQKDSGGFVNGVLDEIRKGLAAGGGGS